MLSILVTFHSAAVKKKFPPLITADKSQIRTLFSIIRNLMSKISLYVWGLGFGVWGLGFGVRGLRVHTLVKN